MERVLLTSENADAFYARKLNLAPEPVAAPAPEAKPAAGEGEPAVESAPAASAEPSVEADDKQIPNTEARQKINLRFSELTEKIKAAEATAAEKAVEAKAAHDARVLAEQRAADLQAKYEPPKPDELGPEPQRAQFVNDEEYIASVKDYAAEKALRERDQKEAQDKIAKSWNERQAAAKAEIPNYDATIAAAAHLVVSNEVRDAILESEVGPKILHHLASNPVLVSELAKMKLPAAMLTIGRLDAKFTKAPAAPAAKDADAPAPVAASEPSRAPAPIVPLKGNGTVTEAPRADGNYDGLTNAQWKALRKAGTIK